MGRLWTLSTRMAIGGRVASATFGNKILFEASDDYTAQQRYALALSFANLIRPLLVSSVELYSITISPVPAPGQFVKDRTKHTIRYFGDPGMRALPANQSVGPLTICAHFVKYAMEGNAGEILIRGCIDETEVDTDADGLLVKPSGDDLTRFETFATSVKNLFDTTGGRGLVMPGPKTLADGTYPTYQNFVLSCREVEKVEFDALSYRQTTKTTKPLDERRKELLRDEIKRLRSAYNEAKMQSDNGVLVQGDTDTLTAIGREIYNHYTQAERNKIRIPKDIKTYIHA